MVETLADILGQKPQHEVAVFLQKGVLATVPAISIGVGQMLRPIQFDRYPRLRAEQVHFHSPPAVKGNRQLGVEVEQPCGVGQRFARFGTRTYTDGRLE